MIHITLKKSILLIGHNIFIDEFPNVRHQIFNNYNERKQCINKIIYRDNLITYFDQTFPYRAIFKANLISICWQCAVRCSANVLWKNENLL